MGVGDDAVSVTELDFEGEPIGWLSGEENIYVKTWIRSEHILGAGEDVVDVGGGDDAQRDFAIDAAEGQVVDLVAEGRNVGALGGVDLDDENILGVGMKVIGEVEGEGSESAFVLAEGNAIDPDGGCGHDAFEVYEDALARGLRRDSGSGGDRWR